ASLASQKSDVELSAPARVAAIVARLREVEPDTVDQPTLGLGAKTDQLSILADDRLQRVVTKSGRPIHRFARWPGPVAVIREQLPGHVRAVIAVIRDSPAHQRIAAFAARVVTVVTIFAITRAAVVVGERTALGVFGIEDTADAERASKASDHQCCGTGERTRRVAHGSSARVGLRYDRATR